MPVMYTVIKENEHKRRHETGYPLHTKYIVKLMSDSGLKVNFFKDYARTHVVGLFTST